MSDTCSGRMPAGERTRQNFERATISIKGFFLFNQLIQEKLKQSPGYERGCNRKLIIEESSVVCTRHVWSGTIEVTFRSKIVLSFGKSFHDFVLRLRLRSLFAVKLYCLLGIRFTTFVLRSRFIACENRHFTNDWGINNIFFNSSESVI